MGGVGGALGGVGGALGGVTPPGVPAGGVGDCSEGVVGSNSAPHSTQTVAIGLFTLPHLGHRFIFACAGLKHIFSITSS